jgi:hypothetical protein
MLWDFRIQTIIRSYLDNLLSGFRPTQDDDFVLGNLEVIGEDFHEPLVRPTVQGLFINHDIVDRFSDPDYASFARICRNVNPDLHGSKSLGFHL